MIRCNPKTDSTATCEFSEEDIFRIKRCYSKARRNSGEKGIPGAEEPISRTESSPSEKYFVPLPEYSSLLGKTWEIGTKAKNQNVARQVRRILFAIQEVFKSFSAWGFDLSCLAPLRAYESEDEAVLIEWIYTNYRIGFVVDPDPSESGWYLVSNRVLNKRSAFGNLSDSNLKRSLFWIVKFILDHK